MARIFPLFATLLLAVGCQTQSEAQSEPFEASDTEDFEISEGAELRNSCSDVSSCLALCAGVADEANGECVQWCVDTHIEGERYSAPASMGCVQQCHPTRLGECLPYCKSNWDVNPGDLDNDGRPDGQDGCPRNYNEYASDWDHDGQEDVCQRLTCKDNAGLDGCQYGDDSSCHVAERTYLEGRIEFCARASSLKNQSRCIRLQVKNYEAAAALCDGGGA